MTRQRGFALFGALIAVGALVCAGIFAGLGAGGFGSLGIAGPFSGGGQGAVTTVGGPVAAAGDGRNGTGTGSSSHRAAPASADSWTGTWAAGPVGAEPGTEQGLPDRTVRNVVHTSIGGTSARVTFSNLYGTEPLLIGHASVAVAVDGGPRAVAGTMRRLTFDGHRPSATIAPGGRIVSDPVAMRVPGGSDLLLTLYTPSPGGTVTYHSHAQQTSWIARGDRTEEATGGPFTQPTVYWRYVTAVDVRNPQARGTIVAFGDSITDGVGSSPGSNHRWPDFLAGRVRGAGYGVVDEGIGGNQVLRDASLTGNGRSGLVRFGNDVLSRPSVRAVIIDLGVNDILHGHEQGGTRIVAGLRDLTRQAHARGLRVIGATLAPFGSHAGYNATKEQAREQVNTAIRAGGVFDAVVDFDRVLRDPYAPDRLRPGYDSGDGLHPSDAGYRAMAEALNVKELIGANAQGAAAAF